LAAVPPRIAMRSSLNPGVDVMGSTGTRFYRICGVHKPPGRSIRRSREHTRRRAWRCRLSRPNYITGDHH